MKQALIAVVVPMTLLVAGCTGIPGAAQVNVDVQRCSVYGLKAFQESGVKRYGEILIKDCSPRPALERG